MSMNSYPNSGCKQCSEPKLGWVHSAHTQGTQAVRMLHPGRTHASRWAQCHGPLRSCRSTCRALAVSCAVAMSPHACTHCCAVSQGVGRHIAAHLTRCVATKGRPPATIQTIVSRHTLVASPCACAQTGRVLAPAGHIAAPCCSMLQRPTAPCRSAC